MRSWSLRWPRAIAIVVSLAVHGAILAALAYCLRYPLPRLLPIGDPIAFMPAEAPQPAPIVIPLVPHSPLPEGTPLLPSIVDEPALTPEPLTIEAPLVGGGAADYVPPREDWSRNVSGLELARPTELPMGGSLKGRTAAARAQLVAERGGSPRSEAAVDSGLLWLVEHQSADGGWRFDHQHGACGGGAAIQVTTNRQRPQRPWRCYRY